MVAHDVKELAQSLFEESGDALFLFDPDTDRLLDANPVAQRLSGYSRRELLRMAATDLFRFEGQGGIQRLRQAVRKTTLFHSQEGYLLRTKQDDVWVPVSLTISRLHLTSHTIGLITTRDIREQREAHARLKEKEEELRRVMASVSVCLWSGEIDSAGEFVCRYVSPVVEKITGRTVDFFLGGHHSWQSVVYPEDLSRFEESFQRLKAGQPSQEEYRVVWPDGSCRWVRENVLIDRSPDGRSQRLHGVISDITERRQAAEALRESEERTRRIIENAYDAFVAIDARGRIADWNRQAELTFGWSRAEVLGRPLAELLVPAAQRAAHHQGLEHFLATGEGPLLNKRTEVMALHRDGHELSVEVRITSIPWGTSYLFSAFLHDITEQKRAEVRLRQVQKIEAVGRLAGGVAHDFNNLLTVINGYSEFLLSRLPPGEPSRQMLEGIRKSGERAASLTRQLLAFSRKQVLEPNILDLNVVVADMEKMLRRLIGEDIGLVTTLAPALDRVKADPGQIEQVIMNLAINARDAMPRGGQLTIETRNLELDEAFARVHPEVLPGPYVRLLVRDSGCGMDEATLPHIFEPFFTTKEIGRGTGLGLATVYGIIKQSEGYIYVDSAPGLGTTFQIFFPTTKEIAPLQRSQPGMAPVRQGNEMVLLVEDEDEVRELARDALRRNGYTVLEAKDGKEALQIGKDHQGPIDLVVTDIVMPQLNGPQLCELLTSLRPKMKVLFLSGYADDALSRHGVVVGGVAALLQKPFTPVTLARKVREVLDGGS